MDSKIDVFLNAVSVTGDQLSKLDIVIKDDVKKTPPLKVGITKGPVEKENMNINKNIKKIEKEKVEIEVKNEVEIEKSKDEYNQSIT